MVRVGYSFELFYQLWPDQRPQDSSGGRHAVIQTVARRPRLLRLLTSAGDLISKAVCPNPLMEFALHSHFEVGLQKRSREQPALDRLSVK
jgi:hypothetical protein